MSSLCFVILTIIISGCKSPYPEMMEKLKNNLAHDYTSSEYQVYDTDGGNRLLALEERGRLCQLKGDWRGSAEEYKLAMDHFRAIREKKPEITVRDMVKDAVSSSYWNDLARDYAPCAFEQMMLHTLDAFNRLALEEWDDFGVNVRNIELWRNEAIAQIDKDAELLRTNNVPTNASAGLCERNAVKRSTDNIYALYLIALYHEIIGEPSNAEMAYRDIERIKCGTATVQESLQSLNAALPMDEGEVVVFFEEGFIPPKRENREHVDAFVTSISSAMPEYKESDCKPYKDWGALSVKGDGVEASTKFLCDLAPLAVKSLEESKCRIVLRQIMRTSLKTGTEIGKDITLREGEAKMDMAVGNAVGNSIPIPGLGYLYSWMKKELYSLYSRESERADLRSWLLLPRQVQIARFPMKAGTHRLSLTSVGMKEELDVEVKPRHKTIVHCTVVPNVVKAFAVCTDKIR